MKLGGTTWTIAFALIAQTASADDADALRPEPASPSAQPSAGTANDALAPQDPTVPARPQGSDTGVVDEPQSAQARAGQRPSSFVPPLTLQPRFREVQHWYGAETLAVDALSLLLAFSGLAMEPLWVLGVAGYVLGGPIIHGTHGSFGRAAGSLALRVALPFVAVGAGMLIEDCSDGGEYCGLTSLVIGIPVGMLAAIIVDASVLARETVREPVYPLVAIRRDALWLGARGAL